MRSDEGKYPRGEFTCRIGVGVRKHINTCEEYESIVDGVHTENVGRDVLDTNYRLSFELCTLFLVLMVVRVM